MLKAGNNDLHLMEALLELMIPTQSHFLFIAVTVKQIFAVNFTMSLLCIYYIFSQVQHVRYRMILSHTLKYKENTQL